MKVSYLGEFIFSIICASTLIRYTGVEAVNLTGIFAKKCIINCRIINQTDDDDQECRRICQLFEDSLDDDDDDMPTSDSDHQQEHVPQSDEAHVLDDFQHEYDSYNPEGDKDIDMPTSDSDHQQEHVPQSDEAHVLDEFEHEYDSYNPDDGDDEDIDQYGSGFIDMSTFDSLTEQENYARLDEAQIHEIPKKVTLHKKRSCMPWRN
jgi:hypothetical protein